MDFSNAIKTIAMDIHEKATAFVEANKGSDPVLYKGAILNLKDGRQLFVSFEKERGINALKIWNYHWDEKLGKSSGDAFDMKSDYKHGFMLGVTIYNLDKSDLYCDFYEDINEAPYYDELSNENKSIIKNYMVQLQKQMSTLEYNKEATCSITNMTYEARRNYNIQRFNDEVQKMLEEDPSSKTLPSVQIAVNWWIEKLTGSTIGGSMGEGGYYPEMMALAQNMFSQSSVDENQIMIFKEFLSQTIMDELRNGENSSELRTDYGPTDILRDAIVKAGISGVKAPFKTSMSVGVDSVIVREGLGAKEEEIFKIPEEEVKHKM